MPLQQLRTSGGEVHVDWALAVDPAEVWSQLTTRAGLATWLGDLVEGDLRPGGRLVVDHGEGYLCESTITHLEPGSRLEMSWEFPDEPESAVALQVRAAEVEGSSGLGLPHTGLALRHNALTLRHTGLGALTTSYGPGWVTHLTLLEAALEGEPVPRGQFWRLYATFERLIQGG